MKTSLPRFTAFCVLGLALALPGAARAADSDPVVIKPAPETDASASQQELTQARAENRRLAAELADAKTKLASTRSAVELLTTENQQLAADFAAAKQRLAEAQKTASSLNEQLAAAKASPPAAPDLSARLAETENKLETTLRSFSQLQAENEKLKAAAADAAHLNDQLKSLRDEKAALEAKLAAAPAQPSPDLSSRLAETEDKLATTLRSFSQLQAENDRLKSGAADVAKLNDELKTLREEKTSLEAKLANPPTSAPADADKLADVQSRLETALRSYSFLQAENEKLKSDAAHNAVAAEASAAKSSGESAAQISALFNELRDTRAQLTAVTAENSQLKTRLALSGPPPGSLLSSPSRPTSSVTPSSIVATPAPLPSASPSSAATAAAREHVVASGDTLSKLSRQYYGTPNRWEEIVRANPDIIKDPNTLPLGATLRIP